MKKPAKPTAAIKLAQLCCRALDEKKAEDLRVLDVSAQSSITDCLVLATATSETHIRALRIELEKALDGAQVQILGVESAQESGWTVVDAFDVMVHIFTRETRARFALENLWKDADEVPTAKLLAAPKPKRKAPKKVKAKR
ncbi:MAG TPA: ribosome silencing factor [Opitutaceae bacterium]|jgi:ribosome-associated protein|nr:ribosome silencing factor [Opitutaceae bacterium]